MIFYVFERKDIILKKKFQYTIINSISFYISYFFYKLIIPLEIKKPRWKMWFYEFIYSIAKFKDYNSSISWKYPIDTIITKFGIFKIRVNTSDAANVSPAFERRDQNYLLRLISELLSSGKKVLFLDIGADIGSYSVLVANKFRNKSITIKSFEPIEESCTLIKENILRNNIEKHVNINPIALSNENNDDAIIELNCGTPGSSTMKKGTDLGQKKQIHIKTKKLDDVLKDEISEFDAVVCKIDVEGMEKEVILGAQNIIQSKKDIYVMVEDFIDTKIIDYLQENGWNFLKKVTSYNSWWFYKSK